MKNSLFSAVLAAFSLLFISGCDTKACQDIVCGSNEFCAGGACFCADGYEGSSCSDLSADKYIGSYLVTEYCSPAVMHGSYYVNINYGYNYNELFISNLFNSGLSFTAVIRTDQNTNEGNALFVQDNQGGISCSFQGYYQEASARIDLQGSYTMGFESYECNSFTLYKQ